MKNILKLLETMRSITPQIRKICAIAIVAVIGFSFIACDNGNGADEAVTPNVTNVTNVTYVTSDNTTDIASFTGTWNASGGRSIDFFGYEFDYKVNNITIHSGTFSVYGSTITFYESDSEKASGNFQLSVSGETLVLSDHIWGNSVNGTYTKDVNSDTTLFTGIWNASLGRSIIFTGNTFYYKVINITSCSGTFSVSDSTITFNRSGLGTVSGKFQLSTNTLILSSHTWDISINGTYKKSGDSVEDYSNLEPSIAPNPYRGTARIGGGNTVIDLPTSLSGATGAVSFAINPADATIARIVSQDGNSCVIEGLSLGTARITVTKGSQSATVLVAVSPSESSYTLPASAAKTLGSYTTWDSGSANRPDTLPDNYVNYIAEPTTQLAWYWKNNNGIDFLAYYVDPTDSNKRGWVRTTFSFGGWRYDLNGAAGNMTNGVQTNGNVRLVLKPEFVYDNGTPYLQITHTLTNASSTRLTGQKFGASADIMIHGNDYAPLTYMEYGALMTNQSGSASPSIKFRLVCQNVQGVNNVSTLWMGAYGSELAHVYDDKRENITGQDSAMNFSYQNIDLNPGESKTFVVRFTQIQ